MDRGPVDGTRWTVIGTATPASDGLVMRKRVRVRCACGRERVMFVAWLQRNPPHSKGCKSSRCAAIWNVAQRFRAGGYPATADEFEARIEGLLSETRPQYASMED